MWQVLGLKIKGVGSSFLFRKSHVLVKYTVGFASGALEFFICALAYALIKVFLQLYPSYPFYQGLANSVKSQSINILGFMVHMVFVANTQPCHVP